MNTKINELSDKLEELRILSNKANSYTNSIKYR